MAHKWRDFRRTLSDEAEARIKREVEEELAKIPLAEVRKARQMTQVRLAEVLQVNQGAISKLERRSDMYLSTLRSYIEAMGGQLEIRAVFPNGDAILENLGESKSEKLDAIEV
jgi:transcriptional regulator with XRE-family HTH domain